MSLCSGPSQPQSGPEPQGQPLRPTWPPTSDPWLSVSGMASSSATTQPIFYSFLKKCSPPPHLQGEPGLGRARNCPAAASHQSVCFLHFHYFLRKDIAQYILFPQPRNSGIPAQVEALVNLKMFLEGEMNEKMCSGSGKMN